MQPNRWKSKLSTQVRKKNEQVVNVFVVSAVKHWAKTFFGNGFTIGPHIALKDYFFFKGTFKRSRLSRTQVKTTNFSSSDKLDPQCITLYLSGGIVDSSIDL